MKLFKVEVIADSSGQFCGNGLRFKTDADAIAYGIELTARWMLVQKFRVVPVECNCVARIVSPENTQGEILHVC